MELWNVLVSLSIFDLLLLENTFENRTSKLWSLGFRLIFLDSISRLGNLENWFRLLYYLLLSWLLPLEGRFNRFFNLGI